MSNMGFLLRGVGHSLERLTLMDIGIVLMAYIVTMYWFLRFFFFVVVYMYKGMRTEQ